MKHDTEKLCGRLDQRRGYNMNTYSGLPVWPADPRPEDIRIGDIARGLSRLCRFNGHIKNGEWRYTPYQWPEEQWVDYEIYSVAQHSVLVCEAVGDPELKLPALLHDASEYVLGDMIKPQKRMYNERKTYEQTWEVAIANRFGFDPALFNDPEIKEADYRMFLTERRDVVSHSRTDFGVAEDKPYGFRIVPLLPSQAYKMFMDRFNELYKGD